MEAALLMEPILVASVMEASQVDPARLKFRVACVDMGDVRVRLRMMFTSVNLGTQGNFVKYDRIMPVPRCYVGTVPVWREMVIQNVYVIRDTLAVCVISK